MNKLCNLGRTKAVIFELGRISCSNFIFLHVGGPIILVQSMSTVNLVTFCLVKHALKFLFC